MWRVARKCDKEGLMGEDLLSSVFGGDQITAIKSDARAGH